MSGRIIERETRSPGELKLAGEILDAIRLVAEAGVTDAAAMQTIHRLLAMGPPIMGKGTRSVALFLAAARAEGEKP